MRPSQFELDPTTSDSMERLSQFQLDPTTSDSMECSTQFQTDPTTSDSMECSSQFQLDPRREYRLCRRRGYANGDTLQKLTSSPGSPPRAMLIRDIPSHGGQRSHVKFARAEGLGTRLAETAQQRKARLAWQRLRDRARCAVLKLRRLDFSLRNSGAQSS